MVHYRKEELIERIDWESIMKMDRYAGGHDDQMQGLLKDVIVLAHYNEGDYQGQVATIVQLSDTKEIVMYNDYYGSCASCDAWDGASDEDVKKMCQDLASNAMVFKTLDDCKEYLNAPQNPMKYGWYAELRIALLNELAKKSGEPIVD